jgi:hypothetical protein
MRISRYMASSIRILLLVMIVARLDVQRVQCAQAFSQALVEDVHENIKPGEGEYPVLSPHAVRALTLTGTLPATLNVRLRLSYTTSATAIGNSPVSVEQCGYRAAQGVFRPFDITEPLDIVRDGNHFHAAIFVDKYLQGRCGWHLELIGFAVLNGVGPLAEGWFARAYDAHRDLTYLGNLYEGRIDEWCKRNPYPPDPRRPEQCSSFPGIQRISAVPPEISRHIPADQQRENSTVWIFPDTKIIEIYFHDLDAMNGSSEADPVAAYAVPAGTTKIPVATRIAEFQVAGDVSALTFSPDNEYLAVRVPTTPNVYVWAWRTGRLARTDSAGESLGVLHNAVLRYSPNGESLALAHDIPAKDAAEPTNSWHNAVQIWNTKSDATGRVIVDDQSGQTVPALEFSCDGACLLRLRQRGVETPGDQFVVTRISDWQSLWGLRVLPFHPDRLAVSPDGRLAALGGIEAAPGVAMHAPIWIVDLTKRAIVTKIDAFPSESIIADLSWSPDGERIAAGASVFNVYPGVNTVKIFSVKTGQQLAGVPAPDQHISAIHYACEGKCLVETGFSGTVTLWDASLQRVLQKIPAGGGAIAVSRDMRFFALATASTLSVWKFE